MRLGWRWDQGRTEYFAVEALARAAGVLVQYDGQDLDLVKAELRAKLVKATELPFAPDSAAYLSVWRNYARIYQASQVATRANGVLRVTDVGRKLAVAGDMSSDDFLMHFLRSCVMPNPAFDDYDGTVRTYPAVAVLRLLMTSKEIAAKGLSEESVISYLAGNDIVGVESPEVFSKLSPIQSAPQKKEERQVREFLRFLSQLSFLHFEDSRLWYNGPEQGSPDWDALWTASAPRVISLPADSAASILALGATAEVPELKIGVVERDPAELAFIEGSRIQRTHVLLERNPRLRVQYLGTKTRPIHCDVCAVAPDDKYPWTKDLVELHHLLPLSSSIRAGPSATLLTDIVPVCPTCHRAVHSYYSRWLKSEGKKDFATRDEAHFVYDSTKKAVA